MGRPGHQIQQRSGDPGGKPPPGTSESMLESSQTMMPRTLRRGWARCAGPSMLIAAGGVGAPVSWRQAVSMSVLMAAAGESANRPCRSQPWSWRTRCHRASPPRSRLTTAHVDRGLVLVGEGPHEDRQDRWQEPVVTAGLFHRVANLLLVNPPLSGVPSQGEPPGHPPPGPDHTRWLGQRECVSAFSFRRSRVHRPGGHNLATLGMLKQGTIYPAKERDHRPQEMGVVPPARDVLG